LKEFGIFSGKPMILAVFRRKSLKDRAAIAAKSSAMLQKMNYFPSFDYSAKPK
jgi:hypothetical protein